MVKKKKYKNKKKEKKKNRKKKIKQAMKTHKNNKCPFQNLKLLKLINKTTAHKSDSNMNIIYVIVILVNLYVKISSNIISNLTGHPSININKSVIKRLNT